jgi:hypothetical protein
MTQRFTLDPPAFEQVLSAISLVQELKKQMPQAFSVAPEDEPLANLAEIQQAIEMEVLDLNGAMQRVVRAALHLNSASGAGVWLFTDHDFVLRAGTGIVADNDAMRLEVLARLSASDLADRHDAIAGVAGVEGPAKSMLVTPVHQGRNIVGALAILTSTPEGFSEGDGARARLLSGLLAHALGKASASELKQSLSLERAAMLEVMDQLMPALRKLGSYGERERHALQLAVAELGSEPGVTAVAEQLAKLGDALPERENRASGAGGLTDVVACGVFESDAIGSEPNVFLLLQKEVEESREASSTPEWSLDEAPVQQTKQVADTGAVLAAGSLPKAEDVEFPKVVAVPVVCAPIAEGMAQAASQAKVVPEEINKERAVGKLAGEAWEILAGMIRAWVAFLSRKLHLAGPALVAATKQAVDYLHRTSKSVEAGSAQAVRQLEDWGDWCAREVADAWRKARQILARPVRVKLPARTKGKQRRLTRKPAGRDTKTESASRKAAGPAVILLIMTAFLVMMKTVGDSSHASVVSPPVTAANIDQDAEANRSQATSADEGSTTSGDTSAAAIQEPGKSNLTGTSSGSAGASDRTMVKETARAFTKAANVAAELQDSHLRITDVLAAATLHSMSHYEFAGLQRQALFGDDTAEFLLGLAYEIGSGVPQNCAQAAEWVARSAAAGNAAAQYNLGLRYREGDGVPADPELSRQWLHKATARKYAPTPAASVE